MREVNEIAKLIISLFINWCVSWMWS